MEIFVQIVIGLIGGVLGGMGMGGGTLLIPLLTLYCSIAQKNAQAINLIAFVPMSIIACILHIKNKLIDFKYLWLSIPALASSVLASFLASASPTIVLKVGFGIFLITLGIVRLIGTVLQIRKSNAPKYYLS